YVWLGSENEPQGGDITAQQKATYQAVRGAGANNMVVFESGIGSSWADSPGMDAGGYGSMTNVAFDLHVYGWVNNKSTDQNSVDQWISKQVGILNGYKTGD